MGARMMDFNTFWNNLRTLEKEISITSPVAKTVKNAYWGTPPKAVGSLPAVINTLSEADRTLGFGSRDQRIQVNVQLLVAKATVEDERSCMIATAFWFASKDAFDKDYNLGGSVSMATLVGADPTVPVILVHAGQAYIGFNAVLTLQAVEGFEF